MRDRLRRNASTKELRKSIAANGGLVRPLYVRRMPDGKYLALEGNRRLTALQELNQIDPEYWVYAPCLEIPDDMDETAWLLFLTTEHGPAAKRKWSGAAKAYVVRKLREAGLSDEVVAELQGKSKKTLAAAFDAIEKCHMHRDLTGNESPEDYHSYWVELIQQRGYKADAERLDKLACEAFSKGIRIGSKGIRDLPKIAKNPAALYKLLNGNPDTAYYESMAILAASDPSSESTGIIGKVQELKTRLQRSMSELVGNIDGNEAAKQAMRELIAELAKTAKACGLGDDLKRIFAK